MAKSIEEVDDSCENSSRISSATLSMWKSGPAPLTIMPCGNVPSEHHINFETFAFCVAVDSSVSAAMMIPSSVRRPIAIVICLPPVHANLSGATNIRFKITHLARPLVSASESVFPAQNSMLLPQVSPNTDRAGSNLPAYILSLPFSLPTASIATTRTRSGIFSRAFTWSSIKPSMGAVS